MKDQTDNNMAADDNSINQLIDELSIPFASVKVTTSLARISTSLKYLAQCDFAQCNTIDELTDDMMFGRGLLLNMLGECVEHFAATAEDTETAISQLQQTSITNQTAATNLTTLHGYYKNLIDLSASGDLSQLELLKTKILLLESKLALPGSVALPNFMRNKTVDDGASEQMTGS